MYLNSYLAEIDLEGHKLKIGRQNSEVEVCSLKAALSEKQEYINNKNDEISKIKSDFVARNKALLADIREKNERIRDIRNRFIALKASISGETPVRLSISRIFRRILFKT